MGRTDPLWLQISMGSALLVAVLTGFACYRAGWRLSMILLAAALAGGAVVAMGL